MLMKIAIETKAMGRCTANENSGGMKQYHTSTAESAVATNPPWRPPTQELKKTAG